MFTRMNFKRSLLIGAVLIVGSFVLVHKALHLSWHTTLLSRPSEARHASPALYVVNSPVTDRVKKTSDIRMTNHTDSVTAVHAARIKRKKIVYACQRGVCGGWADRQKGIVSAYVLAQLLGRDFGVTVLFPCDLGQFMTPSKIDWKVKNAELRGHGVRHYRNLDESAAVFAKRLIVNENMDKELPHDVTVVTWNMEVVQYLRQHTLASKIGWMVGKTVPEIYRQALNDLFTLTPDLQQQLRVFTDSRPKRTQLVCAQMRMGKHNGSFPDVESWHTFNEFPILVDFLSKFNDSKKYRILVTSDSTQIIEMAKRTFPEVLLSIPGQITHTDKSTGKNACDGFKKTILDEYALSTCDVLVISESGIGKIASFLRDTDENLYLFHDVKIEPITREARFPNKRGW